METMKSIELMETAYRLLKSEAYYETYNLFLKKQIAEFESSLNIDNIDACFDDLLQKLVNNDQDYLKGLNQRVGIKLLPKGFEDNRFKQNDDGPIFLSNETVFDRYEVKEVNAIIDCPIELMILDCLWTITVGPLVEEHLPESCYGYRLHKDILNHETRKKATALFKYYPHQYKVWRDGAFTTIDKIHASENVTVFSLDIYKCYYYVNTEWEEISKLIQGAQDSAEDKKIMQTLTDIVKNLHSVYWEKLRATRLKLGDETPGLPIGLISSRVLCNYRLSELDKIIEKSLTPSYYGRYVDDLLIVVRTPQSILREVKEAKAQNLIDTFLVHKGILISSGNEYTCVVNHAIKLQASKTCVYLLRKTHGKSAIERFKKELQRNVSELRFMPEKFELDELGMSLFGVSDKQRPTKPRDLFIGGGNITATLKEMSQLIMIAKNAQMPDGVVSKKSAKIVNMFQGINLVSNYLIWEKLNTLLVLLRSETQIDDLYGALVGEFQKVTYDNGGTDIVAHLRESIIEYFEISWAMALALLEMNREPQTNVPWGLAVLIRKSCLVRDQFIAYPLLEYSTYDGALISRADACIPDCDKMDKFKLRFAPRYIHFHEYIIAYYEKLLTSEMKNGLVIDIGINEFFNREIVTPEQSSSGSKAIYTFDVEKNPRIIIKNPQTVCSTSSCKHLMPCYADPAGSVKAFKIAVANMKVDLKNIQDNCKPGSSPNVSRKRLLNLGKMLNNVIQENCSMFFMPEFAIPYTWLTMIAGWVWRNQIGIVCGLEHVINNGTAYNLIATLLPVTDKNHVRHCYIILRVKNHYAPREIEHLANYRLRVPKVPMRYDMFEWKGVQFAPYLCYELADITHRGLFLSEIDMLIACVYNKDVHYFGDIVDSLTRDLHCFVVQANSSDYGDSCVVQPTKTETQNILRVKGGENSTILTATLNVQKLREFQLKTLTNSEARNEDYKMTPPNFDNQGVINRGKL